MKLRGVSLSLCLWLGIPALAESQPIPENAFTDRTVTDKLLEKAEGHIKADDYVQALKTLEDALKFCPGNARLYLDEALLKEASGDSIGARIAIRTAYRAYPKLGAIFYISSKARMLAKDYYGAITDLNMAIYIEPRVLLAYGPRGFARYEVGDFQGAIEDFTVQIEAPNRLGGPPPYYFRGKARFQLGDGVGAMADLTAALDRNPTDEEAYRLRALQHKRDGNLLAAIKDCDAALAIRPSTSRILIARVWLSHALKDTKSAHRDIDQLLDGDSSQYARPWFNRAMLYDMEDQYDSAAADYQKAISIAEQKSDRATWIYANFSFDLLNRRAGKRTSTDYLKDVFDWPDDWSKRVGVYLSGRSSDDSLGKDARNTKNVFTRNQQECEANYYIGMINLIKGSRPVAEEYFKRAVDTKQVEFIEYNLAMEQLQRLQGKN